MCSGDNMKQIETIEQWNRAAEYFREHGYRLSHFQYSWYDKEGFHAWFSSAELKDIELVTYKEELEYLIVAYKSK
jgi:hypothetical protein